VGYCASSHWGYAGNYRVTTVSEKHGTVTQTHTAAHTSLYKGKSLAPSAPSAPSGLTATAVSSTQINLSWTDNAVNETGFKIERKTGAGGTYAQIATVGANVTAYNNTGLTTGTQYFYRVRANNAIGDSAYSNEANATPQVIIAPNPPTNLNAVAASQKRRINLTWTQSSSSGITQNKVYRSTSGSGGPYSLIATLSPATSYANTGLTSGTTYFYVVTAVNANGESAFSNYSGATAK